MGFHSGSINRNVCASNEKPEIDSISSQITGITTLISAIINYEN